MKNTFILLLILILFTELRSESLDRTLHILNIKLIQDPARTSDNKRVDPEKNLDGSGGRYKNQHKHANGKKFASNKRHIKTAKPSGENGKEGQTSKPKGASGS